MKPLTAEQLIYMRVEPEYSPVGRAGFQTVWRSAGLRQEEISAIEERVQCFQPELPAQRRIQFFSLHNGLVVIARSVGVQSNPSIVDRDRRPGVFAAHCLAVRGSQFAALDFNPFVLLDAACWLDDPLRMVDEFGKATGVAPSQVISPVPPTAPTSQWKGQDAQRLVALGWSADALKQSRQLVLMAGDDDEIEESLRFVFSLLPRSRRLACSFNSYAERCPCRPDEYWAVGATQTGRMSSIVNAWPGGRAIEVDARQGRVSDLASSRYAAGSRYIRWLERALEEEEMETVVAQSPTIEALCEALTGETASPSGKWDRQAVRSFFTLYNEALLERAASTVGAALGDELARKLAHHLLRCGAELDSNLILDSLSSSRNIAASAFAKLALAHIREGGGRALSHSDLRHLRKLALATRNWVLLHWVSALGASPDEESRALALENMSSEEFKSALTLLMQPISPADFVVDRHLRTLLLHERLGKIASLELVELIEAVLRIGQGATLGPLAALIPRLETRDLSRLGRATQGKKGGTLPPELRRTIESGLDVSRPKRGWLGKAR